MDSDQAIKIIKREHSFYNDDRARIDVEPEWQQVIDHIESETKFVALERAAVEAVENVNLKFCHQSGVNEAKQPCKHCIWIKFCQLRAELAGKVGD